MNKFEKRSKNSYNKKAPNYEETFDGKFTVKFKNILLDSVSVPEKGVVADIACGNGRLLKMLAETAHFRGFGADISDRMIEEAKALNPDMDFYVAGCDKLPFEDNSIDVMTVCAAFHHFLDAEKFAAEAKRAVKSGGKLYIAEVYLPAVLRVICNPFVRFSKAGDVKFYSPKEIAKLFENHGFSEEKISIFGRVQLVILRRK